MDKNKDVWTLDELAAINAKVEGKGPEAALRWVVDNFKREEFALACSFAETVLVDILMKIKPDARVFFIDTGLLFKETLETVKRVEERYRIKVERHSAGLTKDQIVEKFGKQIWREDPDACCSFLKVEPMKEALSGLKLWITGLRREETPSRANAPVVGWDGKFNLIKVNPIAGWTKKEVWDYVHKNNVIYNPLLDKGYASIGCEVCTNPTGSGDERSGRWSGTGKTECGLHK